MMIVPALFTTLLVSQLCSADRPASAAYEENAVLGDPTLDCGEHGMTLTVLTREPFLGTLFVEDRIDDPKCRSPSVDDASASMNSSLFLNLKECGLKRTISAEHRGVFVSTSVVVSFHPNFLSKIDRIYRLQCFYMEAQCELEKHVVINMPPPTEQEEKVPMPICRYEVHDRTPEGPLVYHATVGQMVYHKWTCDTEHPGVFCMTVHSCTVADGHGERVELLDEKGCARDKYLLQNIEYVSDLMAGKEAHVYKYADRESMFFDCKITITIKEPGAELCDVPICPDPPRRRRSSLALEEQAILEAENSTSLMSSISEETRQTMFLFDSTSIQRRGFWERHFDAINDELCMTLFGTSLLALFNGVMLVGSVVLLCAIFWRPRKRV